MRICAYCSRDVAVEVSGLWVHKLSDRWVSCNFNNQKELNGGDRADKSEPHLHDVRFTPPETNEVSQMLSID